MLQIEVATSGRTSFSGAIMEPPSLTDYLATHHGVLTRAQALSLGVTAGQIKRRLRTGAWLRVGPSVYRIATSPATWEADARAAALSVRGLVSHRSALRLWQADGYDRAAAIHVSTSRGRRATGPAGASVHRSTSLNAADGRQIAGIPVTGIERSVLDTAAMAANAELESLLDAVLRQRLTTLMALNQALDSYGTQGRTGAGRLRQLLAERNASSRPPDSVFNRRVGQLLIRSGLPAPCYEYEVRADRRLIGRVDLAYPAVKIAIECDSARWHHSRRAFEADPRRKNNLLLAGFQVLAFTWDDYTNHPGALVTTVRTALANAR